MDFDLPEDVRMLGETVARFVDRELIPVEMQTMAGSRMKPEWKSKLEARARDLGLWLLDVPEEWGGMGLSRLHLVTVWEEVARTVALPLRGGSIFGPDVRPLLFQLDAEQRERYLLPTLRGEKQTAFAQTEPDAGSDQSMIRTTAVRSGDHYVLNGSKRYITDAKDADFLQVVAMTDRAKGSRGGLSIFLVDTDTPGFSITRESQTMMGDLVYELAFDDVRVPACNLVGEEGQGMRLAQSWITAGRLYQSCRGLGIARRCLEMMARYAKQRVTFGMPLADRQAVQFKIAEAWRDYELGRLYVQRAAWRADRGTLSRHETFTCKMFCTELGFRVANDCMQVHGGAGLTTELPIHQMWKDIRSFAITEGSSEVMRMVLAREVLREYG